MLVSGSGFLLVLIPARYEYVGGATMCEECSVTQDKEALVSNSLNIKFKLVFPQLFGHTIFL